MSAIEAGHVFLGFSKCGQFLLSYTQVSPTQGLHLNRLAPPKLLNSLEVEVHTTPFKVSIACKLGTDEIKYKTVIFSDGGRL